MSINSGYRVAFEDYTKKHFIKKFEKAYRGAWLTTRKALVGQLKNVDMLRDSGRLRNPPIHFSPDRQEWILKHEFVIAGRRESVHSSGRRLIAYVNDLERIVRVLLIYDKNDVPKNRQETEWWETTIHREFRDLLKNVAI